MRAPGTQDEGDVTAIDDDDRSVTELDDERDREELRTRYYGLLQELRVLLPGTQVLVAFLFTVPFNNRFTELSVWDQRLYGVALAAGVLGIIMLIAPTAFHRLGPRRSRAARLLWSVRAARAGLGFLGVSLVSSLSVVTDMVFGTTAAVVVGAVAVVVLLIVWLALPQFVFPGPHGED